MKQDFLSGLEYNNWKWNTWSEVFLEIMDEIIPRDEQGGEIMLYYSYGKYVRLPKGGEKMSRIYRIQVWFNLSDKGVEFAIFDSYAMRKYVGINFLEQDVPDVTTLLKFRRLPEAYGLIKLFFDVINRVMVETGHILKGRTVVGVTIIPPFSSTKNAEKQRDSEIHHTNKGNEWCFVMEFYYVWTHSSVQYTLQMSHSLMSTM